MELKEIKEAVFKQPELPIVESKEKIFKKEPKEFQCPELPQGDPKVDADYCESFNSGKGCRNIKECEAYQKATQKPLRSSGKGIKELKPT